MIAPVYVVGYGMIDGLGNNPTDCFANMLIDKDFSQDISFMVERNEKHFRGIVVDKTSIEVPDIPDKVFKVLTNSQILAFHSVDQALRMSKLPLSSDVAVIFSSVASAGEDTKHYLDAIHSGKRLNPRRVVNRITDMVPAAICSQYGFMGASVSLEAACSTGLYTIDYGLKLCDEYDYVIVGCSDANMYYEQMKFFSVLGALGNYNCPFDDKREGFMLGEGAGCLILQSEKKVKEYNSNVYAKLYPAGYASDALDMTAPAMDNRGAKISISKALKNSGLNIFDIDVVSSHGTSTPIGDPIEYNVIADQFDDVPIYAPKSKIGHTLGAAGMLETIYAIMSMQSKVIPHCQNLEHCSFDHSNLLSKETRQLKDKVLRTLNNSFAFGGKCVSQVIEL